MDQSSLENSLKIWSYWKLVVDVIGSCTDNIAISFPILYLHGGFHPYVYFSYHRSLLSEADA